MRRRTPATSASGAAHMSVPSTRTVPESGRSRPIISRNRTDLPLPLPPIKATSVPAVT